MGMTINTAIKNGIDLIDVIKEYWPSDKAIDTVGELVKIAKKYQKIEQIVRETPNDDWIGIKIKKVVEDGKID